MSGFSTKGVDTKEKSVGQYLSYGVQKAAIVGYELKTAKSGKQQVVFNFESPKVTVPGFEADPSAKMGGKVGRIQFTIYFGSGDKQQNDEFIERIAIIAKKLGVSEKVDAVDSSSLEDYLNKIIPIVRGKFAWWAVTAEEYVKNGTDKVGVILGLRRYGFIASLDEMEANPNHIKAFDKGNKYDYKPLAVASKDPDVDPISEAFGDDAEMPWDE